MAYGDPYCGKCHKFEVLVGEHQLGGVSWVCDCAVPDTTKDPHCLNPSHDHHDPESPIVLGQRAMDAAELEREEEARRKRECLCSSGVWEDLGQPCPVHAEACGHYKDADGVCTFWGCPSREAQGARPFFEVIDELDEILEDANEQVHDHTNDVDMSAKDFYDDQYPRGECLIAGHVWVCVGTVKTASVIDWSPPKCLRCGLPAPEEKVVKCDMHTYKASETGALICNKCGRELSDDEIASMTPPPFQQKKPEPKHTCGGCHARDLTMEDAKKHISKLLGLVGKLLQKRPWDTTTGSSNIRHEAAAFLRMSENKIRAWNVQHHGLSNSQED